METRPPKPDPQSQGKFLFLFLDSVENLKRQIKSIKIIRKVLYVVNSNYLDFVGILTP